MKILCPTDLSSEANNATAYAAKLAKKTGSTLTLLNVQIFSELTPAEAFFGEEANVRNAQDIFEKQSHEISALFKIDCHSVVVPSLVALTSVIKNEAKNFDLIVMGTDGPDTFVEGITGSKTYKLAAKSDLPILIIPNDVGYSDINRILFAFDYHRIPHVPLKQVKSFALATSSEVTMLQIIEERWTRQIEEEIQSAQSKVLQAWPSDSSLRFETAYAGDHDNSLKHYLSSLNADIVAIAYHTQGLRDRLFHESKIREIITGASYPLLVVHS